MINSLDAYLQVETALGGTWRFPLKLVSIEPPPDDTILIEAFRLNQESLVGFRLNSKSEYLSNYNHIKLYFSISLFFLYLKVNHCHSKHFLLSQANRCSQYSRLKANY